MAESKNKTNTAELEKTLAAKEKDLKDRESALNQRVKDAEDRDNTLDEREEYLDAREVELKKREEAMTRSEKALEKKEAAFKAAVKEGIIDVVKAEVAQEKVEEDLVEVVAVRSDGTPGPTRPKKINGVIYEPSIDSDGFPHFKIPRKSAKNLIVDEAATRHFFVGPDDQIVCDVRVGNYVEQKVYNRCTPKKVQRMVDGRTVTQVRWNPIILETIRKG